MSNINSLPRFYLLRKEGNGMTSEHKRNGSLLEFVFLPKHGLVIHEERFVFRFLKMRFVL